MDFDLIKDLEIAPHVMAIAKTQKTNVKEALHFYIQKIKL